MFVTRFTRRGVETRFLSPDHGGALATAPAVAAPAAAAEPAGGDGSNLASEFLDGDDSAAFENAKPNGKKKKAAPVKNWTQETAHLDAGQEEEEVKKPEPPKSDEEKAKEALESKAAEDQKAQDAESLKKAESEEPVPTEWPDSAKARVGKLTRLKSELTEKLTAAEARATSAEKAAEEAKSGAGAPRVVKMPSGPLEALDEKGAPKYATPESLTAVAEDARAKKAWALANWNGGDFPLQDGTTKPLEADEVRQIFARADEMLESHLPTRRNFLAIEQTSMENARARLPDFFDPAKPAGIAYKAAQEKFAFLKQHPAWPTLLAVALYGESKLMEEDSAAKTAAAKPNEPAIVVAPVAPAAPAAVRQSGGNEKRKAEAKSRVLNSEGSDEDLTDYFLNT